MSEITMTAIEAVRVALSATAFGSWAPEEQRPDQRVALAALSRIERVVEAAREYVYPSDEYPRAPVDPVQGPSLRALREALGELDAGP